MNLKKLFHLNIAFIIALIIIFGSTSCQDDEIIIDGDPFVIHQGMSNWDTMDRCMEGSSYIALVSDRYKMTSSFNTNELKQKTIINKIEFPFRMYDEGQSGTFKMSILAGDDPNEGRFVSNSEITFKSDTNRIDIIEIIPTSQIIINPKKNYWFVLESLEGKGAWSMKCNSDESISCQGTPGKDFWGCSSDGFPFRITVFK